MSDSQRGWIRKAHALHKRQHPIVRRVVVTCIGVPVLLAGVALLVLPGPGLLLIAAGIAVMSLEFDWASKLVAGMRGAWETLKKRFARRR